MKKEQIIEILNKYSHIQGKVGRSVFVSDFDSIADELLKDEQELPAEKKEKLTIESIKNEVARLSDDKFGKERPFTAPLYHLKKEADEAIESGEMVEFADCLLLILDAYRKRFPDLNTQTLLNSCKGKIVIAYTREYNEPDENGVIEHKRQELERKDIPNEPEITVTGKR